MTSFHPKLTTIFRHRIEGLGPKIPVFMSSTGFPNGNQSSATSNKTPIATIAVQAISNQKKQPLTLSNSLLIEDDDDEERTLTAVEMAMAFTAAMILLWLTGAIIRIYKDHKRAK
jgi:hypothetical protein